MPSRSLARTLSAFAPALAVFAFAGAAFADGPEISRIAPDHALAIISIRDWQQMREGFLRSNLGRIWAEPQIEDMVKEALKPGTKRLTDLLAGMNADLEDLKHPAGHIGAALFLRDRGNDKQAEFEEPYFLVVADMGEHADDWQKLIGKYIDRGLDDRRLTTDEDVYRDIKITIIKPEYLENPHANCEDDCEHDDSLERALGGSFEDQRSLAIGRIGSSLLFCNDLQALELAIDRAIGQGRNALADREEYRDAAQQHDRNAHVHAVIFTGPLFSVFDEEDEFGFPGPATMLKAFGLNAIKAIGASLRIDSPDALVDLGITVLAPEKAGLLEIFTEPAGAFDPPSIASPGAASVMRFSVRFDRLMDLARSFARSMPEPTRREILGGLELAAGIATPALEAMGPIVHAITTYRQPFSSDSQQSVYVIDLRDELVIENTLGFLVGQAGGMIETRDFEGTVIYSMDEMEISAAIGLGRLFIGSSAGVENALRAAARPDGPRLADEPEFKDATRALSQNAVAYSYMDLPQYLRHLRWTFENADRLLAERLDQIGIDGEYRDEILRQSRENTPEWQKNLPPVETVTRHLGDMVYELRSTPEGMAGRMLILKPREVAR